MTVGERFERLKQKYHYDEAAALEKIQFIETHCRHVEGDLYGQPLILPDVYKEEILKPIFGLKKKNGKRLIRQVYIQMPRKNAKALDIWTDIPTPLGWKKMKDIQVGDQVFGDDGKPTTVLHTSKIMIKPSYRITFQGGQDIIASGDHLWEVRCNDWRGSQTKIITTDDLRGKYRRESSGELICHVKVAKPVEYDRQTLLIDPYVLGCWLGDGHSNGSRITIHETDAELAAYIEDTGISIKRQPAKNRADNYKIGGYSELSTKLHGYNLIKNKHIPYQYMVSCVEQRMELLKGLMDTDGYVSKQGQCKFSNTNLVLARDVYELVLSLGFKATWRETKAKSQNGYQCACYHVEFFADRPVFKLKRKLERQKTKLAKRSLYRSIVNIEPVGDRYVKCIAVDNQSKLYLAGRHFIPTHNTTMMAAVELALLFNDGEPSAQIYNCAGDDEQANLLFSIAKKMVALDPVLRKVSRSFQSSITYNGSFIKKITSKSDTKHGFNTHGYIYDELHVAKNRDLYDTMDTSQGQRSNPIGILITTPGFDKLSICYNRYEYAKKILAEVIEDDSFWGVIYESDPAADIYSPSTWAIANPLYNYSENLRDEIARKAQAVKNDPAAENSFRRLHLGQWTASETKWMQTELWTSLISDVKRSEYEGELLWLGLDLSATSDLTSLTELYYDGSSVALFWNIWIPEKAAEQYERQFNVPYSRWAKEGHINIVSGNTIDFMAVEERILSLHESNSIRSIGYDEWNSRDLAARLQERHGINVMIQRQGFGLSNALKKIKELILSGKIAHAGNPVVTWAFDNILIKENDEGNIKIVKPKTTGASERPEKKIDPWISCAMAVNEWMIDIPTKSVYSERGVITI
jgi:phage terminase large subunit-like protein